MGETIEIPLSKGYVTVIDIEDADLVGLGWYSHVGQTGRVYARRSIKVNGRNKHEWLHHVIVMRAMGLLLLAGECVDHIDNDPLNNRRENLRLATYSNNCKNAGIQAKKKEQGIPKGARFHKRDKRWNSSIVVNGKMVWLGSFDTMEQAHAAYKRAAKKYHKKFARFE